MSEAKEYLERIKLLDVMIDNKIYDRKSLEDQATRITPVMNIAGVSGGGGNQDKIGDIVVKIADLQEEINRDIDTFIDMKQEATDLINEIKNPDFIKVLHLRYVRYKSFAEIAAILGMKTERTASKYNGRALQAFDQVLKKKERIKQAKKTLYTGR